VKRFATWSSLAFLPVVVVLALAHNLLALVYAASFVVTVAYHASRERRWRKLDHTLAWGVVASNAWLAIQTRSVAWTLAGLVLVVWSLWFYVGAKRGRYSVRHGLWHLLSGTACLCFAWGGC